MSDHFIRPDNDPEPTDAEINALADEYQRGLEKMIASGYEEFGPTVQRRHAIIIEALRAYAFDCEPHKVMTPEEYAAMPLKGWHMVCRDVDGFGGTGVRYLGQPHISHERKADQ